MKQKKKFTTIYFAFAIALLILHTGCVNDYLGSGPSKKETKEELQQLLVDFAVTEEDKNAEGHAALYLSENSTVNFVLKSNGSPAIATLTRDQWIGFFTSWDYDYFPVYSDIEFSIEKGLAADSHLFQGFRDGNEDLFGNDLFVYVHTPEGWKIVSLSSTITAPDDTTDYSDLEIEASTQVIFQDFKTAFDSRAATDFTSLFSTPTAPCFRFKKVFSETYDANTHTAGVFLEQLNGLPSNIKIDFQRLNIDVKDQYTALASASYTISKGAKKLEKGRLLTTLVGTPSEGWKISAMVFSINKSSALIR